MAGRFAALLGGLACAGMLCSASALGGSVPPEITVAPRATFENRPVVKFRSEAGDARFECSTDSGRFKACSSPFRTPKLRPGRHEVRVRTVEGGVPGPEASAKIRVIERKVKFGESVRGRPLIATRMGDAEAKRDVIVVGSIHGNETEGHEVLREIRRSYGGISGVKLWLIESVNPDGVAGGSRKNARGVDLNRNFSYRWSGSEPPSSGYYAGPKPFSEPESRAVKRLVKKVAPRLTVWYHQPWGAVLACGRSPVQSEYSKVSGLRRDCRGQSLPGTATSWQNKKASGLAFVVELAAGELADSAAKRHARAVARIARPDQRRALASPRAAGKPKTKWDPIPYGSERKRQMAAYSKRHYGNSEWRLKDARQIVLHYTVTSTYQPVYNTFASNAPNRGEYPGVCSQFVVDKDGTIYQLTRLKVRCRHTIGLNHRTVGIEIVQEGSSSPERAILDRGKQRRSAQKLAIWLADRYDLGFNDVIGHAMGNDSRYFKDRTGWRNDHSDWSKPFVKEFRRGMRKLRDR